MLKWFYLVCSIFSRIHMDMVISFKDLDRWTSCSLATCLLGLCSSLSHDNLVSSVWRVYWPVTWNRRDLHWSFFCPISKTDGTDRKMTDYIHEAIAHLTARFRDVSKPQESGLNFSNNSEIWQAPCHQCCWDACQILEWYDHYNTQSHGFNLHKICR